jgi:flagellar FliL protein
MTTSSVAELPVVPEAPPTKLPLLSLVIAMVAAVLLSSVAVGGAAFYLVRSGRLSLPIGSTRTEAKATTSSALSASHVMVLEPMVANLADPGGAAYLKMALTLRIQDELTDKASAAKTEKPAKGLSEADAAVRDTVLTVIGKQTAEQLLGADGKDRLKTQLRTSLVEHNPELKVMDLYFVDFLVQR